MINEPGADPCATHDGGGSGPGPTLFVAAAGDGSDGSSWAKAWNDVTDIDWSAVSPGSTVCIAGGSYGDLSIHASGTATARVCIKRATAADADCGSKTPGYEGAFDSQVVLTGISCNTHGEGDYVTVDGRASYQGIKVDDSSAGESYAIDLNAGGASYLRLYNLDVAGVATLNTDFSGDGRCLSANYDGTAHGLAIGYSQFHGKPTLFLTGGQHEMLFEHNKLYDNVVGNPASWHPNLWVSLENEVNVTWRYNEVWNWEVEGIMMCPNGPGCTPDDQWFIYGNVFRDATPNSTSRVLEAQYETQGSVFLYNNTFANLEMILGTHGNGGNFSGGTAANNIVWKSNGGFDGWGISESHNLTPSGDPFVDSAGGDYHLAPGSAPVDAGVTIPAASGQTFDLDKDGSTRGADGHWDVGAYELH
jgi:hypothetical protein